MGGQMAESTVKDGVRQTELYIATEADATAPDRLRVVLAKYVVSALLIRKAGAAGAEDVVRRLMTMAQSAGVAVLIEDDADLARRFEADGVHLSWSNAVATRYDEARRLLGPDFIIGVSAGKSRHDAMVLGEGGADYIGFGLPATVKDREGGVARRQSLIDWWAEIFETPCVAFDVETAEQAHRLAECGADFVCIDLPTGVTQDAVQSFVGVISAAIGPMAPLARG